MKNLLFCFISFSMSAQISGIVKDSLSGLPIPYANIWVEDEIIGTNSESDGTFYLDLKTEKNLIFSALGYETKKVEISKTAEVLLVEKIFALQEVVLTQSIGSKEIKIGDTKDRFYLPEYQTIPWVLAKRISLPEQYTEMKFLKKLIFHTNSEVEKGTFRIRFFSVNENGFPKDDLLTEPIIVAVKKGKSKTIFDVSHLKIEIPNEGIFVGFESLIVEDNLYEETSKNPLTKEIFIHKNYSPHILYYFENHEISFVLRNNKWVKQLNQSAPKDKKRKILTPAIETVLSN
ncbi:MAG: carboxypeptidase-like regulatory domain-containing protein [Flavobacterium sp.]